MRWYVEIRPTGRDAETEKLCVEAEHWQPALQKARELREEPVDMAGLSAEFLPNGCLVIDPKLRTRYRVVRAPGDAPLSDEGEGADKDPNASAKGDRFRTKTMAQGSQGEVRLGKAAAGRRRKGPRTAQDEQTEAEAEPIGLTRRLEPDDEEATDEEDGGEIAHQLISSQAIDPSEQSPLTYRERVYGVTEEASTDELTHFIRQRFEELRAELEGARPGQVVNIAVFDHIYDERPKRPPVLTLGWKDWREGEPEVVLHPYGRPSSADKTPDETPAPAPQHPPHSAGTPAKSEAKPPSARRPPPKRRALPSSTKRAPTKAEAAAPRGEEPADAAPPRSERSRRKTVPRRPPPPARPAKPAAAPAPSRPSAKDEAPRSKPGTPPPAKASSPRAARSEPVKSERRSRRAVRGSSPGAPAPSSEPEPEAEPLPLERAAAPEPEPEPLPLERVASKPAQRAAPRPSTPAGPRLAGDELLADLFEAINDLHFLGDVLEGADFVLTLALEKLPSEVGLVSLFDIGKREYVVVRQTGGAQSVLLGRISQRSKLQQEAMRLGRAVVVPDTSVEPDYVDGRWDDIGTPPRSLICSPIEQNGRYLGLIELANPHDGAAYTDSDGHALTYIGRQFAEFAAEREVILDPERVLADAKAAAQAKDSR